MNVIAEDVTTADFESVAWREKLLALNAWARDLIIDEDNAEFAGARQKATLVRHAEGMEAWNGWANGMLALKAALEAAGQWAVKRADSGGPLQEEEHEATQVWLALATAVFSTEVLTHRFENETSFRQFIFPSDAVFERATFSDRASFWRATFSSGASFWCATFSGETSFRRATFSGQASFRSATFGGDASFGSATFSGDTVLAEVRFNANADFPHAKFEKQVTFRDSIFRQAANFEGIDSAAAFSLTDAKFIQLPSFINATFKGKLRLDNVETPRYRSTFGYVPDKDAPARFRELRRLAAEAQDHESELKFFAQEVRTGRFHAKGLPSWVPKVWSWRFWFGWGSAPSPTSAQPVAAAGVVTGADGAVRCVLSWRAR
jgi:hypothetical protein